MEAPVKGKPFYIPPQRLTMQTPCEIIREARQDVMGSRDGRAVGLRPVATNRPYTPKDRERVLFGSNRKGARPPSAVNLSYLQKTDVSGLKLPTIAQPRRAASSRVVPRSVLSLDNLVEEVESDATFIAQQGVRGDELPGLRKSYSSPQERAVSTPDLPNYQLLKDRWISEPESLPRSGGDTSVNKKKILRLQSLPNKHSIPTTLSTSLDSPTEKKNKTDRPPEIMLLPQNLELPEEPSETETVVEDIPMGVTEIDSPMKEGEENLVPPRSDLVESKKQELVEVEDPEEDMVAVLSHGKLVWEAPPPKKQPQGYSSKEQQESKPKPKKMSTEHLKNMRDSAKQLHGRIDNLQAAVETLASRTSSSAGRAQDADGKIVFPMNNNKRYHMSANSGAGEGVKAYKKWSENARVCEEEAAEQKPAEPKKQETAGWDFFWKNSYFRTQEEPLRADLQPLDVILEELRHLHRQGGQQSKENIAVAEVRFDKLYKMLKEMDGFSQGFLPTSFQSKLLQTLYMYADYETPKLLLYIARLIFGLRVESGLPAACKMTFKVARSDDNDNLFIDVEDIMELFLDGIGRASPLDAAESCIYGYGALKFLTVNRTLLAQAVHLGALDLVTLHLKMVNSAQKEGIKVEEQSQHAIFQLTGALRNIADGEGIGPLFLTTNCIPTLIKTLLVFREDEEIVSNIARTLSSLSSDEELTHVLLKVEHLAVSLVDLMGQYMDSDQIVTRLGYTIGNVLASSDLARVQLSRHESSLPTILKVLQLYLDKEAKTPEEKETNDDVIVKLVRVVANMSMNPVVGSHLSTQAAQNTQLTSLLRSLVSRTNGTVLLAALGCLNNLTYYVQAPTSLLDLTQGVLSVLANRNASSSQDCAVEACRVLGNLTRHKRTRDLIFSEGGLSTLESVLGSGTDSSQVARSVCGVIVNMLLDQDTRYTFIQHKGIDKLVSALERHSGDWLLAGLVCRAIWNACAPDFGLAISHNDMDHLLTTLANCLEEENWVDGDSEWEEFAGIATDLLERFNAHIESTAAG